MTAEFEFPSQPWENTEPPTNPTTNQPAVLPKMRASSILPADADAASSAGVSAYNNF